VRSGIELHDSTISQIDETGPIVVIKFSPAYVHKSERKPGIDAGTGWVQNARLRLTGACRSGDRPVLPENLWDGSLRVGFQEYPNWLPIRLQAREAVELHLVFVSGHEIDISAESIELELTGEAKYVEEFGGGNADPSRSG